MTRWLVLLLGLLLLAGCPRTQQVKATGASAPADVAAQDDPLLAGLRSAEPDVRNFAEYFINCYRLPDYLDPLQELAAADPAAATVCAVVYHDLEPWRSQMQPGSATGGAAQNQPPWDPAGLLGAVYGMRCAGELPPELWIEALAAVPPEQLGDFLWGIAQLDAEPGGPLKRSEALDQALIAQARQAQKDQQLAAIAATDALLGGREGWPVAWQRYIDLAPQVDWTSVQWTALLRWAPAEVWQAVLARPNLDDAARLSLAQAWATAGPAGAALPAGAENWELTGAGVEYRACRLVAGLEPTIALPELAQLKQQAGTEAEAKPLGDLLQALKYAGLHDDATAIGAVLRALPELSDAARSGILATLERYGPEHVTDAQLTPLVSLKDPVVAYWLILGWPERKPVQKSDLDVLLRVSTGHEDVMLAFAYDLWLAHAARMKQEQSSG